MLKNITILFTLLILSSASVAKSDGISYNFVRLEANQSENSDSDIDMDGLSIFGAMSVTENFFLAIGYGEHKSEKILNDRITQDIIQIGVGGHIPVHEQVDFYGVLSLVDGDVEYGQFSDSDTGNNIEVGFISKARKNIEIGGAFARISIFDESELSYSVFTNIDIIEAVSVTLRFTLGEDTEASGVGIRYNF